MKALFLVLHRKNRSPGQRYRHEQYVSYLEKHNVVCHFSPLLKTAEEDAIFYGYKTLPKILIGLKALVRRTRSILTANRFDLVYIYRDAFFFGTFFEKWLRTKRVKIIYDFDDAIWLMDKNENQGVFNKLKNPEKTATITKLADLVIVGNEYLAEYAKKLNSNIAIIPSTIDFAEYTSNEETKNSDKVCIGWTGSFSTVKHFESLLPALIAVKEKYKEKIYFKLIGDPTYQNAEIALQGTKWKATTEASDLSELDIGIMPLPDNAWTKGKCGMKGLQYMALGIATVMSPVGVNTNIIQDGKNGFLASSKEQWIEKLSQLIESEVLRKKLGEAGRNTVSEKYSVEANKDKWLSVFKAS